METDLRRHPGYRRVAAVLLAGLGLGLCATAQAQEPTAEETLALCWINRFRSDPSAFGKLCQAGHWQDVEIEVDWQMFAAEIAALRPAPPLFFNPTLTQAARSHAAYMVQVGEWGHYETPGKPGFSGEWPKDRLAALGYQGEVRECSGGAQSTVFESIVSMVVDADAPGKGTGGMQVRRGHRRTMIAPTWREIGIGFHAFGRNRLSTTQNYGTAPHAARIVGGVAIDDRDGDAFYDLGEGLAGVHIRIGAHSQLSTNSGAWRIDLDAASKSAKLIASFGSLQIEQAIAANDQDVGVDLVFAIADAVHKLNAQLDKLPAEQAVQRRRLQLQRLQLAPAKEDAELLLAVRAMQQRVLGILGTGRSSDTTKAIAKELVSYRGTVLESWLRSAKLADQLTRKVEQAAAIRSPKSRANSLRKLASKLQQAMAETTAPDLWRLLAALLQRATTAG